MRNTGMLGDFLRNIYPTAVVGGGSNKISGGESFLLQPNSWDLMNLGI